MLQVWRCIRSVRSRAVGGWVRRVGMAASWVAGTAPKRSIWYYDRRMQSTIDRVLAAQRFDLVHVEDLAAGVYRFPRTLPKVLTHHEVLRPRPTDWTVWRRHRPVHSAIGELDWHRWKRHQASVMRRFDRILVFSRRDMASIEIIAPDVMPRVRINPFCLEVPPVAVGGEERPGTILFIGSFLHPPNVDAAIWLVEDIMPLLRVKYPGVRLLVVGHDPRRHVQHLALDDVRLTGFVPDLQPLLEQAALVVAPVRIGGGQRMKVLHGMAAGKAVITTSRGAEGLDEAQSRGALRIADDADSFADAAAALLCSVPAAPGARPSGTRPRGRAVRA